jgi:uncharacterized membrane protein
VLRIRLKRLLRRIRSLWKTSRKHNLEETRSQPHAKRRQYQKRDLSTTPLPQHISHNINTVIALHARNEKDVPRHQRVVEGVSTSFGRPAFLYSILVVIVLWMLLNVVLWSLHLQQFDSPPFAWLQLLLTVSSLLMTTGVLIKQNRQEKLAEQREQLNLQINLLSEQKIAKLIALIEELRHDLPNVSNKHDPELEAMKEVVDPHVVVDTLEQTLEEELRKHQSSN